MSDVLATEHKQSSNVPDAPSIEDLGFSARLQVLGNRLTKTEQEAGAYFQKNPHVIRMSITEVVSDSAIGYGSIIRFCQKIGCSGFQDFKVLLAQGLGAEGHAEGGEDSIEHHSRKVRAEIDNTEKLIDRQVVASIAESLNQASRVLVAGIAGSESTASGFDYRLSRLGINSAAVCEGYNLAIRAASLGPTDVFLGVSFSGATKDMIAAARIASENAAFNGSLGKSPRSRAVLVFNSATAVPSALMATASPALMFTPVFTSTMAVDVDST